MSSGFATTDRMVAGNRGTDEAGTGFVDTLAWALGVQRYLKVEGAGFGAGLVDGLLRGAPRIGPPPQRLALGRSPGLIPADAARGWARAKNLAAFDTGAFLIPPWVDDFVRGLGWGLYSDLKGMWDLGWSVVDGSLFTQVTSGLRTALDMLEKQPSFGFALGQQIGGEMVADLLTAAEGSDFSAFVYEVGEVLGPFLLDIIGAIITGGAGPLAKRGAKAAVEFGGDVAEALTRRVRRGFDDLVEAAEAAAGPQWAYPDGIPGPRSPWEKPPNAVFSEKDRLTGPADRGVGPGSRSGPGGQGGPGDPFDPRAAAAGAVATDTLRRLGRFVVTAEHRATVARALRAWTFDQTRVAEGIRRNSLDSYDRFVRRELDRRVDPMEYDNWIWRQDIFNQALQSLAYPDVERILDSLQRGAEEQVRHAFLVVEALHQFINSAPVKGVKDAVAISLPHSGKAEHGNSTVSLARAWRIASGTPQEVRLVHVTNPIVQVFTQGFADELGQLLPPGYTFGQVTRDLSTPEGVGVGPHAEILGARELSELGCVVGVVSTSQRGCEVCIPAITRSYPWLLHLNPKIPPQRGG